MPRAIWNGALSFGLVNIPVQLVSAVRNERPRFHLLHAKDEAKVRYERICEREEKPVPWSEIVKGFEVSKGEYAVLDKEDFKRAALEKSDTIDVLTFVPAGAIDPRYFETPYYLVPGKGGDRAYALLREAVRDAQKIGVGQLVLRQAQRLAAIWVSGDALVLTLLRFAGELAEAADLSGLPSGKQFKRQELDMAASLIEKFSGPWKPAQYHDRYSENLAAIIKAKTKGKEPRLRPIGPETPAGDVGDLMAQLRASLAKRPRSAADGHAGKQRETTATPRARAQRGASRSRPRATAHRTSRHAIAL